MESTPSTPTRSDEILARFGKYEALEEIGIGGMATVYRARDTHLDRLVALKVLHPHLRGEGEARSRFAREAKSVARLEHENIVQVYDFAGEENEHAFLVVELLTGPTLALFRKQTPALPAEIAAVMILLIARALDAAHREGIIHRDVKPENILLHKNETLKLTDFGIAQVKDAQGFTRTGQILGSPSHMAPEQLEGKECDERSDLFSLGTVFYFLLAGRLPFEGKNPHQTLKRVAEAHFIDPRSYFGAIPETLVSIARKLLEREPSERFESAAELVEALEAFLARSGIDAPEALLAAYFADPARVSAAHLGAIKARHLELATAAVEHRDRGRAKESLEYLLALDPENKEANELLIALSSADDRRSLYALLSLLAVGLISALFVFRLIDTPLPSGETELDTLASVPSGAQTSPSDPEEGAAEQHEETGRSTPDPLRSPDETALAAEIEAGGQPRPSGTGIESAPNALERTPAERTGEGTASSPRLGPPAQRPRPSVVASRSREVRFAPIPQNVLISVDGAPPRPFGPAFRQIDLEPGVHTFKIIDQSGCCETLEEEVRIPAGTGPYHYQPRLPFRPARLYLVSPVPAQAELHLADGRVIRARTREILSIPMEGAETSITYTVTASDHRDYTGEIRLRAGQMTHTRVELIPAESD